MIPCVDCLPCNIFLNGPPSTHLQGKLKYTFCVCVGSWLDGGGVLRIAFNVNLALVRPMASEVTLRMAHGCHLEPVVRLGSDVRENIEAHDKAI